MTVYGEPKPGGSKTARPLFDSEGQPRMRDGRPVVAVRPANPGTKPWMSAVAEAAIDAWGPRGICEVDGPLTLSLVFYVPRPDSHYSARLGPDGERVLKDSAPLYPSRSLGDLDKLSRAVKDALTGIVWTNDRRVVTAHPRRRWGAPSRCEITVRRPRAETAGDLRRLRERPESDAPEDQLALTAA